MKISQRHQIAFSMFIFFNPLLLDISSNKFRTRSLRMTSVSIVALILLLPCLMLTDSADVASDDDHYVQDACSVTRHPELCIQSLSSFSNIAKRSPTKWARAGVSVTITEVKTVARFLTKLKTNRRMRGRNQVALSDCIEVFQAAIDELHRSLGVLRRLNRSNFDAEMGDLTTWVSAALTNEDTCLDGFEDQKGKQVKLIQNRVVKATYITSNALALVNKLASTGLESDPNQ